MSLTSRRRALELLAGAGASSLLGCSRTRRDPASPAVVAGEGVAEESAAANDRHGASVGQSAVIAMEPLTTPWQTEDPFLFCMHHDDRYPAGNASLGPAASLDGHRIGSDFAGVDGWRMYHGETVPGFPRHPHRGFETVTVVREGLLDHSDSLGATARYGGGDVQWLTAGRGIQHAEMFPLLRRSGANRLELFQIWLNLPAASKMVDPHFEMLWKPSIPERVRRDPAGRRTRISVIAGQLEGARAPAPPPSSYASTSGSDVGIFSVALEAGATWLLPAAPDGTKRSLYYFSGSGLRVAGRGIRDRQLVRLHPDHEVSLQAGSGPSELLVLQGRPIGEPVARRGPFVMNTPQEIRQAYADYQRTQFGGWPWPSPEHVHPRTEGRFALRPGGQLERPPA